MADDVSVVPDAESLDLSNASSEECTFSTTFTLKRNLTKVFDESATNTSTSVMDKIAQFEQRKPSAAGLKKPPRPARGEEKQVNKCVSVFLRIRPPVATKSTSTSNTDAVNTIEIQDIDKGRGVATRVRTYPPVLSNTAKAVRDPEEPSGVKEFEFHQVFASTATQEDVYSTVAAPLVTGLFPSPDSSNAIGQSALLFAYGSTNAGKTHTILGQHKAKNPRHWGVVPRALQDIFRLIKSSSQPYELYMSYLEVYNDQIYDLVPKEASFRPEILKIRESKGHAFVRGLSKHLVHDVSHGLQLAETANSKRHTSSNNLNRDSSRSHCVCQLEIVLKKPSQQPTDMLEASAPGLNGYTTDDEVSHIVQRTAANMWIVDLAGSERSKRTAAGVQRQKEASQINKSLMNLTRCLSVMRDNQRASGNHTIVPFRDSKLTHLFMNHLTGPSAGRTSMIVNVNPAAADFDETQHILAFAVNAKTISIAPDEYKKKRKAMFGVEYDYNGRIKGRAGKARSKVAKMVKKLSPKKLLSKTNDARKRKAENPRVKASAGDEAGADKQPLAKKLRQNKYIAATVPTLPMANALSKSSGNDERKQKALEAQLAIVQAENEMLKSENAELKDSLTQREYQVRIEVAEEMEQHMKATKEEYNEVIETLRAQINSNPTHMHSTRKAQMDTAEKHIDELVDKVEECEEEMLRMRKEHEDQINELNSAWAEKLKKQSETREGEIQLNKEVARLEAMLKESQLEVEQLKRSKEKMAKNGEATVVKQDGIADDGNSQRQQELIARLETELKESRAEIESLKRSKEDLIKGYESIIRDQDDSDESAEESEEKEEDNEVVRADQKKLSPLTMRSIVGKTESRNKGVENLYSEQKRMLKKTRHSRLLHDDQRKPFSSISSNLGSKAYKEAKDSLNESRVCSEEESEEELLHPKRAVVKDSETGLYLRPRGRAPHGREWDENVGAWRLSTGPVA